MDEYWTKAELLEWVNGFKDDTLFCPDCRTPLEKTTDGNLYCPNEMCLNDN